MKILRFKVAIDLDMKQTVIDPYKWPKAIEISSCKILLRQTNKDQTRVLQNLSIEIQIRELLNKHFEKEWLRNAKLNSFMYKFNKKHNIYSNKIT